MNKILLSLIILVGLHTSNVWSATITRYVNPGSSGGDGTTTALSGANAAYASLSAWEAAEQQDLTDAGGDIMVVNCAGTTADTTVVTINGWTTGSTTYISIIGDNTTGKWDTGKYRLEITGNNDAISYYEDFIRFDRLQIKAGNPRGFRDFGTTSSGDIRISNSIIRGIAGTSSYGIALASAASKIWNNIIYDFSTAIYQSGGTSNHYWYNNTISTNATRSFDGQTASVTYKLRNNLIHNSGIWSFTPAATRDMDYNASSDASADDYGVANNRISQTFSFVDETNDDFHLASGDAGAKDYGTDLSGDANLAFSDDTDGSTRSGTWDIGADENVATTITRYVNPGSAGGNGTTSALSGANAAYASLSAWNTAEAQNLTDGVGDIMVVNCAGSTADTAAVYMSGWTSSAANYIQISGDNTSGKLDTSKYRLEVSASDNCINIATGNGVRLNNLQLKNTNATGTCVLFDRNSAGTFDHRMSNCVLYGSYRGLWLGQTTVKVWNTVIYGMSLTGIQCIWGYATPTASLYNNTIINSVKGIDRDAGTVTATNNYAGGNTTADYEGTITMTTCASSDATGSAGLQNIAVSTSTGAKFTNVTAGSEDLHINTGSSLIDVGTNDPGSGLFSDDLDGVTRSGTWDIGADEFVAAGGTFTPIISLY